MYKNSVENILKNNILMQILFFVSVLPYLFPIIPERDIQPWVFIFSVLLILFMIGFKRLILTKFIKEYIVVWAVTILYFISQLLMVDNGNYLTSFRLLSSVTSVLIIFWLAISLKKIPSTKIIWIAYLICLLIALMQLIWPNITSSIISSVRTSESRGVTSLFPEPDTYARHVIVFNLIFFLYYIYGIVSKKEFLIAYVIGVFQVLILSKAGTSGIFLIFISAAIILSLKINKVKKYSLITLFILSTFSALIMGIKYFPDYRFFSLLLLAIDLDFESILSQGAMIRVFNVPLSISGGLFEGNIFGSGFFNSETQLYIPFLSDYAVLDQGFKFQTAHGGLFGLIFNLGLIGLLYVLIFFKLIDGCARNFKLQFGYKSKYIFFIIFFIVFGIDQSLAEPFRIIFLSIFVTLTSMTSVDQELNKSITFKT